MARRAPKKVRLEQELAHYRELVESTSDWLWEVDETARYTYVSPKVTDLLGYAPEEVLGQTPFDLMEPVEAQRVRALFSPILEDRRSFHALVNVNKHRAGHDVVLETSGVPIFDARGSFRGYRGVDRDVTDRVRTQRALHLADAVVRAAAEGILVADQAGRVTSANPAALALLGYHFDEVVGRPPAMLVRTEGNSREHLWSQLGTSGRWTGEGTCRHRTGESFPVWMTLSTVHDELAQVSGYVALISDMTERRAAEATIRFQATHDMLTQLTNRVAFLSALEKATRALGPLQHLTVFFLDLDGFKPINDVYGHGVGDQLLCAVARRLERCVRRTDLVARFGGDEFTVMLREPTAGRVPPRIAETIVAAIREPFRIEGLTVRVTASVGVASFPDDGEGRDDLIAAADAAMYAAKRAGGDRVHLSKPRRRRRPSSTSLSSKRLRRASR